MMNRRQLLGQVCGGATLAAAWPVIAQAYPSRPIHVVVPYPSGGNTDLVAREVVRELSSRVAQAIVIENKPGANGIIGTKAVANAPADGYTLLYSVGALTINPLIYKPSPHTLNPFEPISLVGRVNEILVVGARTPVRSFAELVLLGKAGAPITYESSGVGPAPHLTSESISQATGMKTLHVPYGGISQSISDIVSRRITFTVNTLASLGPFIQDGRLMPLVVLSTTRALQLPDVPTIVEAGYPRLESYAWQGLLAPARTSGETVEMLSKHLAQILRSPALREKLAAMGTEAIGSTPGKFAAFLQKDTATVAEVVQRARITAE